MHLESGRHFYGGAQQVRYLIDGLQAQGIDNVLVCPTGSEIATATRAGEVIELPMRGDLDPRLPGRLRRLLRSRAPSILHVHSRRGADTAGGWSARWARVPAVLTRRVDNPELPAWARLKYHPYRALIAISSAVERELLENVGLDATRVHRVASAVDSDRYRPAPAHEHLAGVFGLPRRAVIVGVVAQLIPRKGQELLFRCLPGIAARHPSVHVLCFGRGPQEQELSRQLRAEGLDSRVQLVGYRDDLAELLPGLDLLVHPAQREGLGVAVLEALSAGVPVIAAAVGGIPDIIEHGVHGLLVAPGDARALTGALEQLLADPELRRRLSLAGRERVRSEFSVERMCRGNLAVYEQILETQS